VPHKPMSLQQCSSVHMNARNRLDVSETIELWETCSEIWNFKIVT